MSLACAVQAAYRLWLLMGVTAACLEPVLSCVDYRIHAIWQAVVNKDTNMLQLLLEDYDR